MKIQDIMSKNVEIVSPDTPLGEVAKKMQATNRGSVLVAKDDQLVGVITDHDLVLRCLAKSHGPTKMNAEQVMTK